MRVRTAYVRSVVDAAVVDKRLQNVQRGQQQRRLKYTINAGNANFLTVTWPEDSICHGAFCYLRLRVILILQDTCMALK